MLFRRWSFLVIAQSLPARLPLRASVAGRVLAGLGPQSESRIDEQWNHFYTRNTRNPGEEQ